MPSKTGVLLAEFESLGSAIQAGLASATAGELGDSCPSCRSIQRAIEENIRKLVRQRLIPHMNSSDPLEREIAREISKELIGERPPIFQIWASVVVEPARSTAGPGHVARNPFQLTGSGDGVPTPWA